MAKTKRKAADKMNAMAQTENLVVVYDLATGTEYKFVEADRKTSLLTAYATAKGYMSNLIKNNYEKIDGVEVSETKYFYTIGDFTVMKQPINHERRNIK